MMNYVYLRPMGNLKGGMVESLASALRSALPFDLKISEACGYPAYAFEPKRNQYFARRIIEQMVRCLPADCEKLVCVTDADLCTPVLSFVYGEAQLGGSVAVVSLFRLQQEFFSLRGNEVLLVDRLTKECVHELGHCYGLIHCDDAQCAMFFSNSIMTIDKKQKGFCRSCRDFFNCRVRKENDDEEPNSCC